MLFDDRLATVLRSHAQSEPSARTQFRQLLDLLGSLPSDAASELLEAAYRRLGELTDELPPAVQSAILRAPGLRVRNRVLVAWLARGEPQAAAAAMATARLGESDWLYLIPRLPVTARGFLRHRRDLPFSARQVLERLGVRDLVLPEPALDELAEPEPAPLEAAAETSPATDSEAGIGALVRRIEAFQRARQTGPGPAPSHVARTVHFEAPGPTRGFDFTTDAEGVVSWADPAMAPLVVGLKLGGARPGAAATLDDSAARAMARHLPLRAATAHLLGPEDVAGEWRVDAAPVFRPITGHFTGYHGRMRRPAAPPSRKVAAQSGGPGDRMRQLLHELRTPVNAIQGFAELIQQQMFGSAPNEYRALAAAVAVDAARLMAGFDEIDRLARLEAGALELDEGQCDFREIAGQILRRVDGVLRPRSARIELTARGALFGIAITEADALQLAWRLLATIAGAMAPGEIVDLDLDSDGRRLTAEIDLPAALAEEADLFAAASPRQPRAITAGMFGTGFTLRLARAEAEAAGGSLERCDSRVRLVLPVLTGQGANHTLGRHGNGGSSAA